MLSPARPISSLDLYKALSEFVDLPKDVVWLRITLAADRPATVTCKSILRVGTESKSRIKRYELREKKHG